LVLLARSVNSGQHHRNIGGWGAFPVTKMQNLKLN